MPLAPEFAIVHWFCCMLADNNTEQLSSAACFSAQQEDLQNKQTEDEQVSKETKLVKGII